MYRIALFAILLNLVLTSLCFGAVLSAPQSESILIVPFNSVYSYEPRWRSYDIDHQILGETLISGYDVVFSPDGNHVAFWSHNGSLWWMAVAQLADEARYTGVVSVMDNSTHNTITPPLWSPRLNGDYAQLTFVSDRHVVDPEEWRLRRTDIWIQEIPTTPWTPENWTRERDAETPPSVDNLQGRSWQLTNDVFNEFDLAWSLDGSRIAYVSERDENSDIYILEVESGVIQPLTDTPALERYPTWSSNGEWIAFTSNRDGEIDIYRMNIISGEVQRLTSTAAEERTLQWSPDGRYIAYVVDGALYVIDSDGGNSQYLLDTWEFSWLP